MSQKRMSSPNDAQRRDTSPMVRRSTLYVSVVLALFFGLYMGTLIPNLSSAPAQRAEQQAQVEQQGAQDEAKHIAEAEAIVKAKPKDVEAWIHLGNLYYNARMPEKSVMAYTKALEINPSNANVLTDRGTMYRLMKKYDLALQAYRQASKVNPSHENSLFNAGVVLYFDLNRKDEAKEAWQRLVRLNPNAKAPDGQSVKDMLSKM